MHSSSENTSLLHSNGGHEDAPIINNYDNQISDNHSDNHSDNAENNTSSNIMHIHSLKLPNSHNNNDNNGPLFVNSLTQSINKFRNSIAPPFPASVRDMGGTSSSSNEMFNLVKNLIGAGAFGIPSGVAALAAGGSSRSVLLWQVAIPSAVIIGVMAVVFGYYFILVGRICKLTMATSYRDAWDRSAGTRSELWRKVSFCVPLSVILMAGCGNLAYSMILADTTKSLAARFGLDVSRTACLLGVTVLVLLPLCMVKKLSVLAPFSAVGTGGMVFTLVVMALRCFDGSYNPAEDGRYLDTSPDLQPSFNENETAPSLGTNIFLLSCMCFQAFFCHYNAPRYYTELKNNTITRFSSVTNVSFGVSGVVYFAIGIFGYCTFGEHTDGFILNNYSANDDLASICRFAIAVALAFTYPLPFIGTRDGILDLFSVSDEWQTSTNLNLLTGLILSAFTSLAWHFTDLGLVNAVGGAALGTAVVFIFPSIMFYSAVQNIENEVSFWLKCESVFVLVLMLAGISMGVIGVLVVTTGFGE